jgi:hypothetical protein
VSAWRSLPRAGCHTSRTMASAEAAG